MFSGYETISKTAIMISTNVCNLTRFNTFTLFKLVYLIFDTINKLMIIINIGIDLNKNGTRCMLIGIVFTVNPCSNRRNSSKTSVNEAKMPAAAGVGNPSKCTVTFCVPQILSFNELILNRANRNEPHSMYTNATTMPDAWYGSNAIRYIKMAGAMQKETKSEKESNSTPINDVVFVALATSPSNPSPNKATSMAHAAAL
jgi:hypothetical protein